MQADGVISDVASSVQFLANEISMRVSSQLACGICYRASLSKIYTFPCFLFFTEEIYPSFVFTIARKNRKTSWRRFCLSYWR